MFIFLLRVLFFPCSLPIFLLKSLFIDLFIYLFLPKSSWHNKKSNHLRSAASIFSSLSFYFLVYFVFRNYIFVKSNVLTFFFKLPSCLVFPTSKWKQDSHRFSSCFFNLGLRVLFLFSSDIFIWSLLIGETHRVE